MAQLRDLPSPELVSRALAAMHALNRRAKEKRDRRNQYRRATFADAVEQEIEQIYDLKNRFLGALASASLATVERFERRSSYSYRLCSDCGHTWASSSGSECRSCYGFGELVQDEDLEEWFVVACEGYRFHQPGETASPAVAAIAVAGVSHDPNQPQRAIPDLGLTVEAQRWCVELAIGRLAVRP